VERFLERPSPALNESVPVILDFNDGSYAFHHYFTQVPKFRGTETTKATKNLVLEV